MSRYLRHIKKFYNVSNADILYLRTLKNVHLAIMPGEPVKNVMKSIVNIYYYARKYIALHFTFK
jgi:hypothetical protein